MKEAQVLEDGYIAVKDGKILAVGSGGGCQSGWTLYQSYEGADPTTAIDCHTHLQWQPGHEFAKK